jgi:hypothetical protein
MLATWKLSVMHIFILYVYNENQLVGGSFCEVWDRESVCGFYIKRKYDEHIMHLNRSVLSVFPLP